MGLVGERMKIRIVLLLVSIVGVLTVVPAVVSSLFSLRSPSLHGLRSSSVTTDADATDALQTLREACSQLEDNHELDCRQEVRRLELIQQCTIVRQGQIDACFLNGTCFHEQWVNTADFLSLVTQQHCMEDESCASRVQCDAAADADRHFSLRFYTRCWTRLAKRDRLSVRFYDPLIVSEHIEFVLLMQ